MHVLVTGATGFVGFHTVQALLAAGHSVRLGIRSEEKMRRVFGPTGLDTSDHAVGEITDADSVARALDGCEGVVHTAAVVNLDARQSDYVRNTNFRGTELVIGGAAERGMQSIVYVSSVTALYNRGDAVMNEQSALGSQKTGYGRSKVDSEKFVQKLQAASTPVAITYPGTILGPDDPGMSEGSQGLTIFFNTTFLLTSGGMQIVDVRDLAKAHVSLLEGQKSGRYLLAGQFLPWADLLALLNEITGKSLRRVHAPGIALRGLGGLLDVLMSIFRFESPLTYEAATYATRWVPGDDSKVHRELGLEYRPLRETLTDAILWLARTGQIDAHWMENIPASKGT